MNTIGSRILQRRKELNITQTQIQQTTGISSGNLSCIENGKYLPSAATLIDLSKALDCSVEWLLTGKTAVTEEKTEILDFKERELVALFRSLTSEDQDDLIEFLRIKNKRIENNTQPPIPHQLKGKRK